MAHRLLAWADVFIEAFTPGTVDRLGIGYEKARSINPSIIMLSTCLMGQTGSLAGLGGFGYHAAAIAGFYEVTGWPDLPPDGPWLAYTDTIAPHFLSAGVMAALDHRRRTGHGQAHRRQPAGNGPPFPVSPDIGLPGQRAHGIPRRQPLADGGSPRGLSMPGRRSVVLPSP